MDESGEDEQTKLGKGQAKQDASLNEKRVLSAWMSRERTCDAYCDTRYQAITCR